MNAHEQALAAGRLAFQRCRHCGHAWLPAREDCPRCLQADWAWEDASGGAKLVSWVVYHTAYDPAWASRVPYNVAIVELAEGPRLITNILAANDTLRGDMPLRLVVEQENERPVPRFAPA